MNGKTRGRIIQKFLEFIIRKEHVEVKIGSVGFALLNGKVYMNHLEYRTRNIVVRVVQMTISVNWWRKDVTSSIKMCESQPESVSNCRLHVALVGLEVTLYHNCAAYHHLSELLKKQNEGKAKQKSADEGKTLQVLSSHCSVCRAHRPLCLLFDATFPTRLCSNQRWT